MCLGLVGVILLKKLDKITPIEVLEAVPDDALVFIEEIDFEYIAEKFIPENRIWIDFVNTTGRNKLDSMARNFLFQISTSEALSDLLRKEGMSLSLHPSRRDRDGSGRRKVNKPDLSVAHCLC